jgi:hypothetical protein
MRNTRKAVLTAGILVMAVGQPVQAQQAERIVQFHAPFAFQVENTKLAAGDYILLEQSGWVQIQTKDGKNAAHVLTMPVASKDQKTTENSQVVFHNYAGKMFLAEIWAAGQEKGRELIETHEEQQLAKQEKMANVSVLVQTVAAK